MSNMRAVASFPGPHQGILDIILHLLGRLQTARPFADDVQDLGGRKAIGILEGGKLAGPLLLRILRGVVIDRIPPARECPSDRPVRHPRASSSARVSVPHSTTRWQ